MMAGKDITVTQHADDGQVVHQSTGDADTMIIQCALQYAIKSEVNVIADDTDILVLLMYHWKQNMAFSFRG